MGFADGVDHHIRFVELHVLGAVSREDLPGVRRQLQPARLRLSDLPLKLEMLRIRVRRRGKMADAVGNVRPLKDCSAPIARGLK